MSWFDNFIKNLDSGDWILFALLILNGVTLFFTARWIRRQARTSDLNSYLKIREQFSNGWRKFRDADEKNKNFELVEVLSLLEGICHLYNKSIFYGATKEQVRDYMREVIPKVLENEYAIQQFINSISSPKTYSEIRKFAKAEKIKEVEKVFQQANTLI